MKQGRTRERGEQRAGPRRPLSPPPAAAAATAAAAAAASVGDDEARKRTFTSIPSGISTVLLAISSFIVPVGWLVRELREKGTAGGGK